MQFIKNMKFSQKLISSFLIMALVSVVVGGFGITGMHILSQADEEMYQNNAMPMGNIAVMYDLLATQRICASNMVIFLNTDPAFSREEAENLIEKELLFEESLKDYESRLSNEKERLIYADIQKIYFNDFALCKQAVKEAVASGDEVAMALAIKALDDMGSTISDLLDAANVLNNELASKKVEANKALSRERTLILIIVIAVGLALSGSFALLITSLVAKPLKGINKALDYFTSTGCIKLPPDLAEQIDVTAQRKDELGATARDYQALMERFSYLSAALDKVATGDLTSKIELASNEDAMGKSLHTMIENFNHMFFEINAASARVSSGAKQVTETAANIAASSEQIAGGAQTLAEGTAKQAVSVENVSSSIAQIAQKTKANASKADQAAKLADTIINKAEKGSRQMEEMITAVNDINEASKAVSNIMQTINGIAAQTNLLSLNAAIEAARAGEHGKGFAVVADEVRKLAAQSEEAVKETSSIIQNSMQKAELGAHTAGEMAASLNEMVADINESNRLIMEIASDSEEQSISISQINTSIDQVAQIVQQNSALSQESASASEESAAASEESAAVADEMKVQSDMLGKLVTQFKLKMEI